LRARRKRPCRRTKKGDEIPSSHVGFPPESQGHAELGMKDTIPPHGGLRSWSGLAARSPHGAQRNAGAAFPDFAPLHPGYNAGYTGQI
jgi:hypothetical protein